MESELCDHQRFHMENWSQHDVHASLVCVPFVLCAGTSFTQLPATKTIGQGRFGFGASSAGYFFSSVKTVVRSLEIWNMGLAQQQWFLLYFILWWILGKFWPWKFFKWNIFRLKIPVSIGQICQAFKFFFFFWYRFLAQFFVLGHFFICLLLFEPVLASY